MGPLAPILDFWSRLASAGRRITFSKAPCGDGADGQKGKNLWPGMVAMLLASFICSRFTEKDGALAPIWEFEACIKAAGQPAVQVAEVFVDGLRDGAESR